MDKNKQIGRLQDLPSDAKSALLVGTYLSGKKELTVEQLDELESLGNTFGLVTKLKLPCPIREFDAGTFLGKGKVLEIGDLVKQHQIDVVVFDDEITPQQQRNLEKLLQAVVVDRTELILAVFDQRAHTKEARIQVELASFQYQLPRLRRMWTHLSRQRSGGSGSGFTKGEGEKQIEIDRRILRKKIDLLRSELTTVKKQRQLQRKARERRGIPTFAIIGYTNAGKSTLLNALTQANVLVEDKLFATLDTTTRKFTLPNKQEVLLIDTVGFIRKIPHQLVAAFKSTLEEAFQADILLHLIDVSNPSALLQAEATFEVLKELGAEKRSMITLLNKVDRLASVSHTHASKDGQSVAPDLLQECDPSRLDSIPLATRPEQSFSIQSSEKGMVSRGTGYLFRIKYPKTVEISALNRMGFDLLQEKMMEEIALLRKVVRLRVPQSQYAKLSPVLQQGKVLVCEYEENDIILEVDIPNYLESYVTEFYGH